MNGVHSLNRKQNWLTIETSATKTEKTKKGETIKAALKIILGSEALGLKMIWSQGKKETLADKPNPKFIPNFIEYSSF
jgi:hypothetical protein